MRFVVVEPEQAPRIVVLENASSAVTFKAIQDHCGGYVRPVYAGNIGVFCNEDARILKDPPKFCRVVNGVELLGTLVVCLFATAKVETSTVAMPEEMAREACVWFTPREVTIPKGFGDA